MLSTSLNAEALQYLQGYLQAASVTLLWIAYIPQARSKVVLLYRRLTLTFFIAELRQNEKCYLNLYCRIHLVKGKCGFEQKRKEFGGLCAPRQKVANFHSQFNFKGNSHSGLLWNLFEICICSVWITFWNVWRAALAVETHFSH